LMPRSLSRNFVVAGFILGSTLSLRSGRDYL
jgi:hypothetical protein